MPDIPDVLYYIEIPAKEWAVLTKSKATCKSIFRHYNRLGLRKSVYSQLLTLDEQVIHDAQCHEISVEEYWAAFSKYAKRGNLIQDAAQERIREAIRRTQELYEKCY